MARGGKKEGSATLDTAAEERTRLKKIAFSTNILSQKHVKVGPTTALGPSKTVIKHHGKDILRKSQRKNRYLFSFPGLLGPISGGKIGELKDLGTKNPVLYLEFPQGQMKLFGTIIYPKNRYLTLQFPRGGKSGTCDDYFDNMECHICDYHQRVDRCIHVPPMRFLRHSRSIRAFDANQSRLHSDEKNLNLWVLPSANYQIVFSDAWWVGTTEENPEELRLPFPKEVNLEKRAEYDFKGGVGATCDRQQVSGKPAAGYFEKEPPEVDIDDDLADSLNDYKEPAVVTPTRQSSRTAGRTFKFAEASSGDDFVVSGAEASEEKDDKVDTEIRRDYTSAKTESSRPLVFEVDKGDISRQDSASRKDKWTTKATDLPNTGHTSLVQTTLSSLFKKVEETKAQKDVKEKRKSKTQASGASSSKNVHANLFPASQLSDPNNSTQVEDDDIEEFSTTSEDMDASDEDWTA